MGRLFVAFAAIGSRIRQIFVFVTRLLNFLLVFALSARALRLQRLVTLRDGPTDNLLNRASGLCCLNCEEILREVWNPLKTLSWVTRQLRLSHFLGFLRRPSNSVLQIRAQNRIVSNLLQTRIAAYTLLWLHIQVLLHHVDIIIEVQLLFMELFLRAPFALNSDVVNLNLVIEHWLVFPMLYVHLLFLKVYFVARERRLTHMNLLHALRALRHEMEFVALVIVGDGMFHAWCQVGSELSLDDTLLVLCSKAQTLRPERLLSASNILLLDITHVVCLRASRQLVIRLRVFLFLRYLRNLSDRSLILRRMRDVLSPVWTVSLSLLRVPCHIRHLAIVLIIRLIVMGSWVHLSTKQLLAVSISAHIQLLLGSLVLAEHLVHLRDDFSTVVSLVVRLLLLRPTLARRVADASDRACCVVVLLIVDLDDLRLLHGCMRRWIEPSRDIGSYRVGVRQALHSLMRLSLAQMMLDRQAVVHS